MHRAVRTFCTVSPRPARRAITRPMLGLAALTLVGACARRPASETGLNKDFALADQLQRINAPSLVTPQDLSVAAPAQAAPVHAAERSITSPIMQTRVVTRTVTRVQTDMQAAVEPTPAAVTPRSTPNRVDARAPDHSADGEVVASGPVSPVGDGGSAGTYGAGTSATGTSGRGTTDGGATSAPVYRQPQAHAARDGVFASVAGAILGAAASGRGDRVRGALIGAVAGGAIGAIYGQSADRTYSGYRTSGYSTSYRTGSTFRTY